MAAVLCGQVDQIILTGGIAYNDYTREILQKYHGLHRPHHRLPRRGRAAGALPGALRVVNGEEEAKEY